MAATSLCVELLFPLTLFSRTARRVLVPAGLLFLIGIRALMGPTFEQFMLCYVFWVPWERVLYNARGYVTHLSVRGIDVGPDGRKFVAADGDLGSRH
jgi:hypothetical protein